MPDTRNAEPNTAKPSIIVLAVDGLRASSLGAYGNTWFATPTLDRLASESFVFDQALAASPDLASTYQSLWGGESPLGEQLKNHHSLLVTDDASLAEFSRSDAFDQVAIVPDPENHEVVDEATETAGARTLALLLDQLEQAPAQTPVFAWTHLRFASGPWDAPLHLADGLLDEDDPTPNAETSAPSGTAGPEDDELAFAATVRYAAQVMALDYCLGVLPTALDEVLGQGAYVLAVVGLRGFALGEHGRVGIDDERPFNEMRHVPLVIRHPADPQHRRSLRLVNFSDLTSLLLASSTAEYAKAGADAVWLHSPDGHAYQDQHWKLYQPTDGDPQLYGKPDDRWEMNDVAVRHHHVIEELEKQLRSNTR